MPEYADSYPRGIGNLTGDLTALRAWARASDIDKGTFTYRDGMIFLGAAADGTLLGLDDNRHCLTVAFGMLTDVEGGEVKTKDLDGTN